LYASRKASSWACSAATLAAAGCRPSQRFQGLVEALDLALGLGVTGHAVLLADAEVGEQVLEAVAAAGEAGRVDRPVVSERGGGPAVGIAGRDERGHHVVAGDPPAGGAVEQVAGVVVEPGADLDLAPVRQAPVGEVGLPQLVGQRGLEAPPGTARALARLGHDEAGGVEDAPDGRGRRDGQALAPEVPGDGSRTRVQAAGGELDPHGDDPLAHGVRRAAGAGVRPARSRLDRLEALVTVPAQEPVQVAAADAALHRCGGDGPAALRRP
jgi:hypothetical protein